MWVTGRMVFSLEESWRDGEWKESLDLLWLGVSKGSAALEERVVTSGDLKGRGGRVGEEGGSGRRCTSVLLLSTIHIRAGGPQCLPCLTFATVHCRAGISCYKETVHCRHVAICCSTLISSLDNDQHRPLRLVTKEVRTCSQIFPSPALSRK